MKEGNKQHKEAQMIPYGLTFRVLPRLIRCKPYMPSGEKRVKAYEGRKYTPSRFEDAPQPHVVGANRI